MLTAWLSMHAGPSRLRSARSLSQLACIGACQPELAPLLTLRLAHAANSYQGNNRSCLVSNCLFRMGCAASMLSNQCACALPCHL